MRTRGRAILYLAKWAKARAQRWPICFNQIREQSVLSGSGCFFMPIFKRITGKEGFAITPYLIAKEMIDSLEEDVRQKQMEANRLNELLTRMGNRPGMIVGGQYWDYRTTREMADSLEEDMRQIRGKIAELARQMRTYQKPDKPRRPKL